MLKKSLWLSGFLAVAMCVVLFAAMPFESSIALRRNVATFFYEHEFDRGAVFLWQTMATDGDRVSDSNLIAYDYWNAFKDETFDWDRRLDNYIKADRRLYGMFSKTPEAMFNRAVLRAYGGKSSEWFQKSVEYMKRAAAEGHPIAIEAVNAFEANGEASEFYRVLADHGDPISAYSAAVYMPDKDGGLCRSLQYFRQAAHARLPVAMVYLGESLIDGKYLSCKRGPDTGADTATPEASDNVIAEVRARTSLKKIPDDQIAANYLEGRELLRDAARLGVKAAILDILKCYGSAGKRDECALRTSEELMSWYDLGAGAQPQGTAPRSRINANGALELNVWLVGDREAALKIPSLLDEINETIALKYLTGSELPIDLNKANSYFEKMSDAAKSQPGEKMAMFFQNERELRLIVEEFFSGNTQELASANTHMERDFADGSIRRISPFDVLNGGDQLKYVLRDRKSAQSSKIYICDGGYLYRWLTGISRPIMDAISVVEHARLEHKYDKNQILSALNGLNDSESAFLKSVENADNVMIFGSSGEYVLEIRKDEILVTISAKGKTAVIPKKFIQEARSWQRGAGNPDFVFQ
jgi:TPR repeat protein